MSPIKVETPQAMLEWGARCAAEARPGDLFALVGTMGAGKTHWTQGFVNAISPNTLATSPTFSLLNEYRGGKWPVFHFDFHRLQSAEELIAIGWDEYLDEDGITICEWADLYPEVIPLHSRWLEIKHQADGTRLLQEIIRPERALNRPQGW